MAREVKYLKQVVAHLEKRYGSEKTKAIMDKALKRYDEIVKGYCDADDICYGNLHPRLTWERTKTIGHGDDVCDFKVRVV